jgi:hypothetical protein
MRKVFEFFECLAIQGAPETLSTWKVETNKKRLIPIWSDKNIRESSKSVKGKPLHLLRNVKCGTSRNGDSETQGHGGKD